MATASAGSESNYISVILGDMIDPGHVWVSYRRHPKVVECFDQIEAKLSKHFTAQPPVAPTDTGLIIRDDFVAVRTSPTR